MYTCILQHVIFIVVKLRVIEHYLFRNGVLIFLHCFHETWLKASTERLLPTNKIFLAYATEVCGHFL